jgi:hypothetical protein
MFRRAMWSLAAVLIVALLKLVVVVLVYCDKKRSKTDSLL